MGFLVLLPVLDSTSLGFAANKGSVGTLPLSPITRMTPTTNLVMPDASKGIISIVRLPSGKRYIQMNRDMKESRKK